MADKKKNKGQADKDGIVKVDPKFITDSEWGNKTKEQRRRKPKSVPKEFESVFKAIDIHRGTAFIMEKYGLTKEEVLSEANRLIRNFEPKLLRP